MIDPGLGTNRSLASLLMLPYPRLLSSHTMGTGCLYTRQVTERLTYPSCCRLLLLPKEASTLGKVSLPPHWEHTRPLGRGDRQAGGCAYPGPPERSVGSALGPSSLGGQ